VKVQFADYVLDADARTVCRETAAIHLSPKAFQLRVALIELRGRALSKTEPLERVWPDVFVWAGSLAHGSLRALRRHRRGRFLHDGGVNLAVVSGVLHPVRHRPGIATRSARGVDAVSQ
jgi:hypothetical protein